MLIFSLIYYRACTKYFWKCSSKILQSICIYCFCKRLHCTPCVCMVCHQGRF